jgi:hypothetical protein
MGCGASREDRIRAWWKKSSGSYDPERKVKLEWLEENAQFGDIIATSGDGIASDIIKCNSAFRDFSHVMIVVPGPRDPSGNFTKCLSDAYEEYAGTPCYKQHACSREGEEIQPTGVQFVSIRERLQRYTSGKIAYRRRLTGTIPEQKLIDFYLEISSWRPKSVPFYYKLMFCWDFYEVAYADDDDLNVYRDKTGVNGMRRYFVCTAWVAEAMMKLGLMRRNRKAGNYNLGHFVNPNINPIHNTNASYSELYYVDTLDPSFFAR